MTYAPRDVVHLDVSRPLPDSIAAASAGRGAYVVVWHGKRPVGDFHLSPAMLPLSAAALIDLVSQAAGRGLAAPSSAGAEEDCPDSRQQGALEIAASMRAGKISTQEEDESSGSGGREVASPTVSVVVCTRDRPQDLRSCLQDLTRCDPPADEILVVDNASQSSQTNDVVAEFEKARYILESRVGLDIARNTGAQAAGGDVVAYVDDDVQVYPQWVSCIRSAFEDEAIMALTGPVLARELETRAQWIFEAEWGFNRGYRQRDFDPELIRRRRLSGFPAWEVGAGANMAFRREVFERIGFFDVRLDVGAAGCSGDSEYWYRLMAAGMKCRYDPRVVVNHRHRDSMKELNNQLFAYMRGQAASLLVQFERHRHWGNLVRLGFWLPLYYLKRIVRRVTFGPSDGFLSIRQEMLGTLSGVLFYLRTISLDRGKWSQASEPSVAAARSTARGAPGAPPPRLR